MRKYVSQKRKQDLGPWIRHLFRCLFNTGSREYGDKQPNTMSRHRPAVAI